MTDRQTREVNIRVAKAERSRTNNSGCIQHRDMMFGSIRVGFSAELRFLRYRGVFIRALLSRVTFAFAKLSCKIGLV